MNRDIVLGSSIVLGALVLGGTVLVHDVIGLDSLEAQCQVASAIEANSSQQNALQAQTQETLERHFRQEQQFILYQLAQQNQTLQETWTETANQIADAASQAASNDLADPSVASANDASEQAKPGSASANNSVASIDDQSTASDASDQADQADN